MALTPPALAAVVFADHLARYPTAIDATRENPNTGVPRHCIPEAFISALCTAYVNALLAMVIRDLGSGVADLPPPLPPIPVPFTFPGIVAAKALFLVNRGWVGPQASGVVSTYIGSVLQKSTALGLLCMQLNTKLGTGTGVVSPASNPALQSQMRAALNTELPLAFQACGKFAERDVPGGPVNATLAAQLPTYAEALALGVASITAVVGYIGTGAGGPAVTAIINSGGIK